MSKTISEMFIEEAKEKGFTPDEKLKFDYLADAYNGIRMNHPANAPAYKWLFPDLTCVVVEGDHFDFEGKIPWTMRGDIAD